MPAKDIVFNATSTKRDYTVSVLVYVLGETIKLLHPFVPFITEKIYSSMPNKNGYLMLQDYPRYNSKLVYSKASKDITLIMDIIRNVRNIKATLGAAPSKKVTLFMVTENKSIIKNGAIYIQKLAGVDKIEFVNDKSEITEKIVSQVVDGAQIFIPLGELVDFDKEIARLETELKTIESEIKRASGKLSNNGFLDKAPKQLVEQEREKLNKFIDMREKLLKQLKDLKGE